MRIVISLSAERRPNAIRVAVKTDIGTARTIIDGREYNMSSRISDPESPFPRRDVRCPRKKLISSTNRITVKAKKNGGKCSRITYLVKRYICLIRPVKAKGFFQFYSCGTV